MTMIGLSNRVVIAGGGLAAVRTAKALRELQHRGSIVMSRPALIQTFVSLVNDAKLDASRATPR
jgi:hypothetical protein